METDKATPKDIDEYIASFPADIQEILQKVRATIREAAPEAQETIKYGMPTFTMKGNLVSFAAYKQHIGVYPVPSGSDEFNRQVAVYKTEKSTARFPLDQPLPYELIADLVRYRVNENLERAARKDTRNS